MWGNILTEVSYLQNFNMGFSNTKSDILIHLTQWQYWWWFWFTFLWVLYYLLVARVFRYRTLKFNPRIASTLRPHGKWGDFLTCLVPITWCINILINSNFILKLIEWQSESSLFTLRVRAKQWYWIYKLDLRNVSDVFSAPRSIGRNKWQSFVFGDLQTAEDYLHIMQIRAYSMWSKDYWKTLNENFKKKDAWDEPASLGVYKQDYLENLDYAKILNVHKHVSLISHENHEDTKSVRLYRCWHDYKQVRRDKDLNDSRNPKNDPNYVIPCEERYAAARLIYRKFMQRSIYAFRTPSIFILKFKFFLNRFTARTNFGESYFIEDDSVHTYFLHKRVLSRKEVRAGNKYMKTREIEKDNEIQLKPKRFSKLLMMETDPINKNKYVFTDETALPGEGEKCKKRVENIKISDRKKLNFWFEEFARDFNKGSLENNFKPFGILRNTDNDCVMSKFFTQYDSNNLIIAISKRFKFNESDFYKHKYYFNKNFTNGFSKNGKIDFMYRRLDWNSLYENLIRVFRERPKSYKKDLFPVLDFPQFSKHTKKLTKLYQTEKLIRTKNISHMDLRLRTAWDGWNKVKTAVKYPREGLNNYIYMTYIKDEKHINETNIIAYEDYDDENRLIKVDRPLSNSVRILKKPYSDIYFSQKPKENLELFRFRFHVPGKEYTKKPILPTVYLTFKQKRYVLKNHINPQLLKKGVKGTNYSTNPFLKNRNIIEENFNKPTDQYKFLKKSKTRSENFKVRNWNRLLRARRVLVLPAHVNITVITNSFDIVHSWHIPGLGLKMDCLPGRATHHTLYIDNVGFYYGQCAEICGRYHHHMPIRICALPYEHFLMWWYTFALPKFLFVNTDTLKKVPISASSHYGRKFSW